MLDGTPRNQPSLWTLAEGIPVARNDTINQISTASGGGHVLFTSTQLIEQLAHFSRERIPERVVHAKASAAWGQFEVTDDVSDLTDAAFLNGIGKKTEILARISTVGPERGSADTVRDFRGFAIKFKTEEGNNDWVFNNQPVFFVRNPAKFPSLNRSHKRHPTTNATDADMFWDFHVNSPESIHALMFLFGDRGLPKSVRHVNAYSGNTYKLTKADGSYHYARIHILSDQTVARLDNDEAAQLAGIDPDNHVLDLQHAISTGNYPTWTVYFQTIDPSESPEFPVFDMTKVWPHKRYPLRRVGRMTLNRNPANWFAEVEQAAFTPSNMVRGIEPSPDAMLQARMFAYPDAARYRLGVNYQFLPANAAKSQVHVPTERDGAMNFKGNYGGQPNYVGSGLTSVRFASERTETKVEVVDRVLEGPVSISTQVTEQDFVQPRALRRDVMSKQDGAQERFIENATGNIADVKSLRLRCEIYGKPACPGLWDWTNMSQHCSER